MVGDSSIEVILVDPNDKSIGTIDKLSAHRFGMLHRAFSVMIFRVKNPVAPSTPHPALRSSVNGQHLK